MVLLVQFQKFLRLGLMQNLQLMALLLLRHVAPLFNADVEKALTYFYVSCNLND